MSEHPQRDIHWDPDEFRRHGYEVIDWIADYWRTVGDHPVKSQVAPGQVRAALPASAPHDPEPFDAILRDIDTVIMPGITHWQSPSFFAYFPGNSSGPSILGDLVSSGLAVQGMLWETSPACTELEMHVLDWLCDALGLPARFRFDGTGGGVIQDSASSATLCAVLAARYRASGHETPVGLTVYTSEHAHSSIEKAVRIAGLGPSALRMVPADDAYAMDPHALAAAVEADVAAGLTPCMVVATVGTTSSTAIDPVADIARICQAHGMWLHVDAALAGCAAVVEDLRWIHAGVEHADSYCTNPHKWLLTNFDCDALWVADRAALVNALSVLPEYLRNASTESGHVVDYRDWQVPLGRRFRALKLWFVFRSYGIRGLQEHVRRTVGWAQDLARRAEADGRWEVVAPVPLNLVCLRAAAGDDATRTVLERINASGAAYVTHTKLGEQYVLRVAVGAVSTRAEHVEALWSQLTTTLDDVLAEAA